MDLPSDYALEVRKRRSLADGQACCPLLGMRFLAVSVHSSNERSLTMIELGPVDRLRRQYLQCLDPVHLILPERGYLKHPKVQKEIYNRLFIESAVTYLPPERYRFRVLKRIVTALENAVDDPDEDVCNGSATTRCLMVML